MNRGLATATYLALFLFGAGQGLLGSFFYNSGPPPLASLAFDAAILATCLFGAWGTQSGTGGFAPALGWFLAAFVMASGTHEGSVIITATGGGEWFLFGGAACALVGALAGFTLWSRRRPAGPPPGPWGPRLTATRLARPGPLKPPDTMIIEDLRACSTENPR